MKLRLKPIDQQIVVLLGATSGIGLETAMQMAEKGAQVVIVGRSQEGLNDAVEQVRTRAETSLTGGQEGNGGQHYSSMSSGTGELNAAGGMSPTAGVNASTLTGIHEQVIGLEADVTNFEQLKAVADQVIERFGRIDTWVNVAAVSEWALFEDTTPDEFRRIIEVNLIGQAFGAMAALPYLKQQANGGALIFVASIAGRVPIPYQSAYNASKHGLLGLVETMRQELKHTGVPVSVTAIIPASINTQLFEKARTKLGVEPEPIRPIYEAKLVSKAICYAAEHPVRELMVGDAGYMITFMRRLAPTLTSNYMSAAGFRQQRSNEPKSAQAPDNMYTHMTGYETVQGEYTPETMRFSPLTWLSTHPRARMALLGSLMAGTGALVGWRIVVARNKRRGWRYQLPRQAKKLSKQASKAFNRYSKIAGKTSQKVVKNAGETVVTLPVISSMPMFRKKSMLERVSQMALGWWAAITALQLPFIRRKSRMQRVMDRLPSVSMPSMPDMPSMPRRMPWQRRTSMVDRITLAEQRKAAVKASQSASRAAAEASKAAAARFAKQSGKLIDQVDDRRKQAAKVMDKTINRADDQRKETTRQARKAAKKTAKQAQKLARLAPSKSDIKEIEKLANTPMMVRKQSLIERLPFGERRETIVERLPYKK